MVILGGLFYFHISNPKPLKQRQLHNLWGPLQDESAGPRIQKLLRISNQWLWSIKPSAGPLCAWNSVTAQGIYPQSRPCPKMYTGQSFLCPGPGHWCDGCSHLTVFSDLRNQGIALRERSRRSECDFIQQIQDIHSFRPWRFCSKQVPCGAGIVVLEDNANR